MYVCPMILFISMISTVHLGAEAWVVNQFDMLLGSLLDLQLVVPYNGIEWTLAQHV